MKKLIYVRPSAHKGRLTLGIEGGEIKRYSVGVSLFESLRISRGDEINDAVFEEILLADYEYRATKKALSLLSISDVSEKMLVLKLRRAGYPREISERVAAEMLRLGYIDESRQLSRLILREANEKLRGRGQIVSRLVGKGYPSGAVCEALDSLVASGEVSFEENSRRLCEKMLPKGASEDDVKRLLYKYGYKGVGNYD